jgi:hypothetical protein
MYLTHSINVPAARNIKQKKSTLFKSTSLVAIILIFIVSLFYEFNLFPFPDSIEKNEGIVRRKLIYKVVSIGRYCFSVGALDILLISKFFTFASPLSANPLTFASTTAYTFR